MLDGFTDTSSVQIDTLESFTGTGSKPRIQTHFAVRYFNARVSDENVQRTENIKMPLIFPLDRLCLPLHQLGKKDLTSILTAER